RPRPSPPPFPYTTLFRSRQFEQEADGCVLRENFLCLAIKLVSLGLIGGHVQLLNDRVKVRVLIADVIIRPRIDIDVVRLGVRDEDRKSTRLNSSHVKISY